MPKNFIRFKTIDGKTVYINMGNVYSVERGNHEATTKIISVNGASHLISMHVEQVLALVEGRDDAAANILFGRKKT